VTSISILAAVAADQLELAAAGYDRDQPMTVIFDFVQPAVTCRRLLRWRYDLQPDRVG